MKQSGTTERTPDMNEEISFPFSLEFELKIEKMMKKTGMSRDEVIAKALSSFLSSMGL